MQVSGSSETIMTFNLSTRSHNPQDTDIHIQRRHNDKFEVSVSTSNLSHACYISNLHHLHYTQNI